MWLWGDAASPVFTPPTETLPFLHLPGAQPLPRFEHSEETDSDVRASPFPAPSCLRGSVCVMGELGRRAAGLLSCAREVGTGLV